MHHGLCHASHIYTSHDVEAILGPTRVAGEYELPLLNTLLSSETGRPFSATTFDGLLAEVLDQILTQSIHTDSIADSIVTRLAPKAVDEYVIWSFRSSLVLKGICAKIEACPDAPLPVRRDLVDGLAQEPSQRIPLTPKQAKLAVVGMSCRLPGGANDLELYWRLLAEGRDVHTTVPPDRFDLSAHYDPTEQRENTTNTPYMNFMDRPGFFDAGFFNMSPREALETDPMHRLALVTAYEALEMAGCVPNRTRSTSSARVGSYYGQASDDWRELVCMTLNGTATHGMLTIRPRTVARTLAHTLYLAENVLLQTVVFITFLNSAALVLTWTRPALAAWRL